MKGEEKRKEGGAGEGRQGHGKREDPGRDVDVEDTPSKGTAEPPKARGARRSPFRL